MSAAARGFWGRQDRAQRARDAEREERLAHHAKYGERMCETGALYPFGTCGCWGCRQPGDGPGTEREGQE